MLKRKKEVGRRGGRKVIESRREVFVDLLCVYVESVVWFGLG